MAPLQPDHISLTSDASVRINSRYWNDEIHGLDPVDFAGTVNGRCENDTCRGSTNSSACNNYSDCAGSINKVSCVVSRDSEEPIGP